MNRIPLIDADSIIYRAGFAADSQIKKELFGTSKGLDPEKVREGLATVDYVEIALGNCKAVMQDIVLHRFGEACGYKSYLTGKHNFREQLATIKPYKGNRDPNAKPKYYAELKEYLIDHWKSIVIDDMEADDAVGIEQYAHKDQSTCIVSIDKDLDTIPGWHYNWVKGLFYYVTLQQANNNFLGQMLEGDTTDNIPGITGIGTKTIEKLLASCDNDTVQFNHKVIQLYKQQYGLDWLAAYNEVASLLWILRDKDKPCPFMIGV